jgi:hypothetical protein
LARELDALLSALDPTKMMLLFVRVVMIQFQDETSYLAINCTLGVVNMYLSSVSKIKVRADLSSGAKAWQFQRETS